MDEKRRIWIHVNTSARSNKWKCGYCDKIAYYPQSAKFNGCPYMYCPNCGEAMENYAKEKQKGKI